MLVFIAAVISDGKDACSFRVDDYFAKALKAEYAKYGGGGPNFYFIQDKSYIQQAIDSQYKYPLPAERLQTVITQTSNEQYNGKLCDGTYIQVAKILFPILTLIPLAILLLLFGLYRVTSWVSKGFKS